MIAVRREGGWKGGGVFSGWFDGSWCSMDNHSGFSKGFFFSCGGCKTMHGERL